MNEPTAMPPLLAAFPVRPLDRSAEPALRARVAGKAIPPGALGRIAELAIRLALIRGTPDPAASRTTLLLFAADHGLNEEGVSAFPSVVTAAMARVLATGRGTANAFAEAVGAEIRVVDIGIAGPPAPSPYSGLLDRRIRAGTRNAAREDAMTPEEAEAALLVGATLAAEACDAGADLVAPGEMGIGNTASAALLMHRLLPAALDECIGDGAGHDAAGLARKRAVLARAAARSDATAPLAVLRAFGGLEIAAMAGAMIGAASRDRPVLVDGFIAGAAALVATRLEPAVADRLIFAHRSAERGHGLLLAGLGARPLLDLDLRLGEGTGALLAVPLCGAAAAFLRRVAALSEVLNDAP